MRDAEADTGPLVATLALAGGFARRLALMGLATLGLAGLGAWLLRNDAWIVQVAPGLILLLIGGVGVFMLGLAGWLQVRRGVWHFEAGPTNITLEIRAASGSVLRREMVRVADLREARRVEADDEQTAGTLLVAARGKGFKIPAELLAPEAFAEFARRRYPGVRLSGF